MDLDKQAIELAGRLDLLAASPVRPMTERLLLTTRLKSLETKVAKALKALKEMKQ